MTVFGLDTSNYTTSAALYRTDEDTASCASMPLPVDCGALGLRQSDALFHHVKQLPQVLERIDLHSSIPHAIGVSTRPRPVAGSYMPCFLAGESAALMLSGTLGIPLFRFSHQEGHMAAAAWSSGRMELLDTELLAWHVSGGTTELLMVRPSSDPDAVLEISAIGGTEDLCAGQLIDRVGKLLGLPFPAGPALEDLAACAGDTISLKRSKKALDSMHFNLSGLQNKAQQYLDDGQAPETVARFILDAIEARISGATRAALEKYPGLPVLFAGGVMSNRRIRKAIEAKFSSTNFASPEYSRDNALGVAILAARSLSTFNVSPA